MQVSLESSERIRMQQKELINLLQRSAVVAEGPLDLYSGIPLSFTPGIIKNDNFKDGLNWYVRYMNTYLHAGF